MDKTNYNVQLKVFAPNFLLRLKKQWMRIWKELMARQGVTLTSLNKEIARLDSRATRLETEANIQFRDLFNRVKRIESILLGSAGATLLLLISIVIRM